MQSLRRSTGWALVWVTCLTSAALAAEAPEESHEHVPRIVVTATPLERSADELAVPVTVVTREHLLQHIGSTLGESLTNEPGIHTSGFAPGSSRPVIRGQDLFRVRTLENGLGSHDVSVISADHGVPINPLTQERIEIVRGPSTLRYGSGAIAGVVNAIDGRIPRARMEKAFRGEIFGAWGSNARQRDGALLLEGGSGAFAFHLNGARRDSDDFERPESSSDEPFTDTDGYTMAGGAAWIGESGRIGVGVSRFSNEYGIPAPEEDPLEIHLDRNRFELEADWLQPASGIEAVRLRSAFSDYEHDEIANGVEVGSTFESDEWEARVELLHAPLGGFTGALGFQLGDRDIDAAGEGAELLSPADTRSYALYAFEELALSDRTTLQLAARVERTEADGTPIDDRKRSEDFLPLSASAGVVLDLTDTRGLAVTVSAAQRAPDTYELFARGPHEATETFEIGDPDLDEETSLSFDVSLRESRERWEAQIAAFYTRYSDFVFGRFTGASRDEDGTRFADPDTGELTELVYEDDDATFFGVELEGHVDLGEVAGGVFGVDAQLDFVRARLDSGNVPRIPPLSWGTGVYFSHERATARLGVERNERQSRLGDGETRTSAYTYVNASLSIALTDVDDPHGLELWITGRNLLDEKGRNHVSFKKEDVLLPGRDVRFAVRGRF